MARIGEVTAELMVEERGMPVLAMLAALLVAAAGPAAAGQNVWTPIGPNGGLVSALVADPAHPQILYAGTRGGVFKSVDGGAAWQPASRGLQIHPIQALAIDPREPGTVYAATGDATSLNVGLAVSDDGGATWSQTYVESNGYARDGGEEYFSGLALDPVRPGTVLAASNFAILVSRDHGQTWSDSRDFTTLNPESGVTVQLAADAARGSVFAYVTTLSADTAPNPFAQLLESTDGGATWEDRSAGLPPGLAMPADAEAGSFAIETTPPSILYLVRTGHILRSVDGAASWHTVAAGNEPVVAGPHGLVIAASGTGTVKSTNGGRSWSAITPPPIGTVAGYAFGATAGTLYAAGTGPGVLASQDGGKSWQAANQGLAATAAVSFAVDPFRPARIYTATADANAAQAQSGVWKTGNGGGSWRLIGNGQLAALPSDAFDAQATLLADPTRPGALLYGSVGDLSRSLDYGVTWTHLTGLPDCFLPQTVVAEPTLPAQLYAVTRCANSPSNACSAWGSADGGETWDCLGLADTFQIVVAPGAPRTLYAVTYSPQFPAQPHVLWTSADAGASWTPIDADLPPARQVPIVPPPTVAVDPGNAQRLFAAFTTGIWRSLDGGAHWSAVKAGLPLAQASSFPFATSPLLAIDPNNPQLLYVGAKYLGVYRSLDGGSHWQPILAGLPPLDVFYGEADNYEALLPDPRQSGTVYLATWGNGLLSYTAE